MPRFGSDGPPRRPRAGLLRNERGAGRGPLLAALVLVVAGAVVMWFVTRPPAPRATVPAAGSHTVGSQLLAGDSAAFRWRRDTRADLYRLEVYDLSSRLLGAAVLRDTVVLARAVLPETARAGLWRVVPVSAGGTELPPTDTVLFERPLTR